MQKETERNNNNNNKEENHVHLRLFPQRIRQRIFGRFHCRVYVAWSLFAFRKILHLADTQTTTTTEFPEISQIVSPNKESY